MILAGLGLVTLHGAAGAEPADSLALVTQQFRAYYLADAALHPTPPVDTYVTTLGPDGSWPDLDYHSQRRGSWVSAHR
jgi:hypothetical protein